MDGTRERRGAIDSFAVDGALLAVVLMWASTFVTFKIAWRDIDPVAFTGARFAFMVTLSVAVLAVAGPRKLPRRGDLPILAASGLTGYFLYQLGFVLGLDRTSAVASAILVSTNPMFSVLFSWMTGRERPTRATVAGLVVGFAGVAVFLGGWNALGEARAGDLLSLGAAAAFGAYGVINQGIGDRFSGRQVMAYGLAIGGTLTVLVSLPAMLRQDWGSVGGGSWLILVYSAIGPVYVAYALWNWAIRRRGIARTVVFAFLVPVLGGLMAVLFLNEHVRPEQIAGGVLVVAGLVITRLGGRSSGALHGLRSWDPRGRRSAPASAASLTVKEK
jgi:drug/metabolite transporter (DMT)-like permease